ncbi:MAG: methylenetetrahydrofolate reductase [Alphaproteobacteria bacterium]|nr:methylenetetrahydrofolate reductase [Alphaproteobacteria bacterium]
MAPLNESHNSPVEAASTLRRRFDEDRFVVTAEVTPPVTADPDDFIARALPLKGIAAAVNVTDGAGAKSHLASIAAAHFLVQNGIEPILQMTCRDRNRIALQSDLLGAVALGVRNVLILSGDDPKVGDQPEAKAVFDLDSRGLLATAQKMRREHKLLPGTEIKGGFDLFIGAADVPTDPPPRWDAKGLKSKADAGADFIQTQFCMDIGVVRRYAARLVELGLSPRLRILIGLAPIPSVRSARWMKEKLFGTIIPDAVVERIAKAADARAEGKRICIELLRQLAEVPGISGAHVMAPLNPSDIPEVIAASGVTAKKRAL